MIEIRLLQVGEEETFIKLKQESLKVAPETLMDTEYNPPVEYLRRQIQNDKSEIKTVVLLCDGDMLGFCQIVFYGGKRSHKVQMKGIYIRRDPRVEGQLLGKNIVEFILDYLRKNTKVEEVQAVIVPGHNSEKLLIPLGFTPRFTDVKAIKLGDNDYRDARFWTLEL